MKCPTRVRLFHFALSLLIHFVPSRRTMDTKQQVEIWLDTFTLALRPLAALPEQQARKHDPFCSQLAALLLEEEVSFEEASDAIEKVLGVKEDEDLRLGGKLGAALLVRVVRQLLARGELEDGARLDVCLRWVSRVQRRVNQVRLREATPSPEEETKRDVSQSIDRFPAPRTPSQATPRSPSSSPTKRPLTDHRGFPVTKRRRQGSTATTTSPSPLLPPSSDEGFNIGDMVLARYPGYDDWPALLMNGARAPSATEGLRTSSSLLAACPPCTDEWWWLEPSTLAPLPPERAKALLAKGAHPLVDADTRMLWEGRKVWRSPSVGARGRGGRRRLKLS
ncbi:hypothetical protein BCR35DRAFT_314450 [Leucosporidium creatinivorum]|uniref:PWWP domain-containing protein n=1 Tax=Leucosporidium creatinivorum TaxID=106004 RepID=A0A1Y2EZ08_9BASI|nr:hypothetical protein BCR35DRAFT_314450 [Leucosporidium creatinivorum]